MALLCLYADPYNGSDSNSGKGVYKISISNGGIYTINYADLNTGDVITGAISGATAYCLNYTHSSGSWGAGTEAGTLYISAPNGTFQNGENLTVGGTYAAKTASLATVEAMQTINGFTNAKGHNTTTPRAIFGKSPAPASLGQSVTFTNQSANITLASPVTSDITLCEATTGWTGYSSVSISQASNAPVKQGTYFVRATMPSTINANTKYIVYDLGSTTDLSAYKLFSFWLRYSTNGNPLYLVIKFCSDSTGDTVIGSHTYTITGFVAGWMPFTISAAGGAFPSNTRSIAVYSAASGNINGSTTLDFDNMFVSNTITLNSYVSPDGTENLTAMKWMPVKSITGTTLVLDRNPNNSSTNYGWPLATVTNTIYYINPIIIASGNYTTAYTAQQAGVSGTWLTYEGGYNLVTMTKDGYTQYDQSGVLASPFLTMTVNYNSIDRFFLGRCYKFETGSASFKRLKDIYIVGTSGDWTTTGTTIFDGQLCIGCMNGTTQGLNFSGNTRWTNNFSGYAYSSGYGFLFTGYAYGAWEADFSICHDIYAYNNGTAGLNVASGILINNATTAYNGASLYANDYASINNLVYSEGTLASGTAIRISLQNLNGTSGNDQDLCNGGNIYKQTTTKPSDASVAWQFSPTSTIKRQDYRLNKVVKYFQVNAGSLVTCKCRVYCSNSAIQGGMRISAGQVGLTSDVIAVSSNTTDWTDGNALVTMTFTPSVSGIVALEFIANYLDTGTTYTYSAYIAPPAADGNGNIPLIVQS